MYVLQSRASRFRCSIYLVPSTVHASTQNTIQIRGTGVCLARKKTPCEQGLPHCTYVLQAEQRLPHATEKAKRSFLMERGPTAKHHPACNPQRTQWFRAESFRSSALNQKSCHASVSLMLEKRSGRCRTDGPIRVLFCQKRHTIAPIKAAWCRSLC